MFSYWKLLNKLLVSQDSLYSFSNGQEKLLFNREKETLFNEITNTNEIYSPIGDELTLNYVKDQKKYKTSLEIMKFIQNFKILNYSMSQSTGFNIPISATPLSADNILMVEPDSSQLDTALMNINKDYPDHFNQIKAKFIEIFPQVEDLIELPLVITTNLSLSTIFIKESILNKPYPLTEAASGMRKILSLLTILFSPEEKSIILIDELENSLDYLSIVNIGEIIKEVSHSRQIIIVTHSPILANVFDLDNWIISERQHEHTKFYRIREDNDLRNLMKQNIENFSLYTQNLLTLDEQI